MGKTIKKVSKEFKGMNGTQINYLKQSIKYGHLEDGTGSSKKQQHKYKGR